VKICKCTPEAEQESILGHFLLGGRDLEVGVVHLVVLDRLLRTTAEKVVNFFEKKVQSRTKFSLRL